MDPPPRSIYFIISHFTLLLCLQFLPGTAIPKSSSFDFSPDSLSDLSLLTTSGLNNGSLWFTRKATSSSSGATLLRRPLTLHNPLPSISANFSFSVEDPNLDQFLRLFTFFLSTDTSMPDLLHSFHSIKDHSIFSLEFNTTHLILSAFRSLKAEALIWPPELKKGDLITAGINLFFQEGKIELTAFLADQVIRIISEENFPEKFDQHFYFGYCFSEAFQINTWSLSHQFAASPSLLNILLGTMVRALAIEFLLPVVFSSTRKWQFSIHTRIMRGRNFDLHLTKLPGSPISYILKRFKMDARSRSSYLQELSMIRSLRHESILELKGWCDKYPYENLLVYEFMPNGNLHENCLPHLVHGDIKSKNVFLDSDFEPKLAGCGLALQGPPHLVAGVNWEYAAPECRPGAEVDEKADVYSYGVLLLEICSGRMPIGNAGNFVGWFKEMQASDRLLDGADERILRLVDVCEEERIEKFMKVGLVCTENCKQRRPSMRWVLKMLKGEEEMR